MVIYEFICFFKKENIKQSFVQENFQNSNSIQKGRIVCNKIDLNNDVANILKQKYIVFDIETTVVNCEG